MGRGLIPSWESNLNIRLGELAPSPLGYLPFFNINKDLSCLSEVTAMSATSHPRLPPHDTEALLTFLRFCYSSPVSLNSKTVTMQVPIPLRQFSQKLVTLMCSLNTFQYLFKIYPSQIEHFCLHYHWPILSTGRLMR